MTPQDAGKDFDGGVVDTATPGAKICDGSQGVRLRVYVESQPSREAPGAVVQSENGFQSIAIDGLCQYWINGTWNEPSIAGRNAPWRTGILSDDNARSLEVAIDIGKLEDIGDCRNIGAIDVPALTIRSPLSRVRCLGQGDKFNRAFSMFTALAPQLLAGANLVTAGIHVVAVPSFTYDGAIVYEWPLSQPISDFLLPRPTSENPSEDPRFMAGVSKLVVTADATAALRSFRARYLEDLKQGRMGRESGPLVKSGDQYYVIYMRDQLPYEDAKGLLPFAENQ